MGLVFVCLAQRQLHSGITPLIKVPAAFIEGLCRQRKMPLPSSTKGSSKTCRTSSKQFLPIQKLLRTHDSTRSPKLIKYW
jgi:hypothetical protein